MLLPFQFMLSVLVVNVLLKKNLCSVKSVKVSDYNRSS